jgi:16S rRNA G966 N2-methylase RsmD
MTTTMMAGPGGGDRNSPQAQQLLHFLSNELYKDGGTTLAPWLKEYAPYPKRINAWLVATVGSPHRLLTFIERFPDVFAVSRDKHPHTVSLKTMEFCDTAAILCDEKAANATNAANSALDGDEKTTAEAAAFARNVQEKALYVLRRRSYRISRRKVSKISHNDDPDDNAVAAADENPHESQVNASWLLHQCAMEVHHYLRAVRFYPTAYQTTESIRHGVPPTFYRVGEREWSDLVLASFQSLIQSLPDIHLVDDGKKIAFSVTLDNTTVSPTTGDCNIKTVGIALRDAVAMDGATQVCLSLLLSRYDNVKKLVGGRDVMALAEADPEAFQELELWKNDIGDVVVRLREDQAFDGANGGGRMQVDEVGLFSVASGRWGTAAANVMAQEAEKFHHCHPRDVTAIDITASVGGLTLALSKRFGAIIAIEIDEHRAALCVRNMQQHGRENVDVRNVDAMDALDDVDGTIRSSSPVALIIDPPWGGFEYKRLKKTVTMGQWSLDEVLVKCCRKLSPVVIGVRLPINHDCSLIEASLTAGGIVHDVLQRRKLGPQLLFVIAAR